MTFSNLPPATEDASGSQNYGNNVTVPPLPPPPPPTSVPPPAPVPRKRSFVSGCLLALLLFTVLAAVGVAFLFAVGSFIGFFFDDDSSLASSMSSSNFISRSRHIRTSIVRPGSGKRIAVIAISGVISNTPARSEQSASKIIDALRAAVKDGVCAIILDMDTPGGEVTASDEIWRQVKKCRAAGVPVVTCMRSMGASGGYYIAAGSDWIVANRTTFTGSIGVIMAGYNAETLLEKIGVEKEVYRSGDMKDMLNWGRARTNKERTYVKAMIDETFRVFVSVIAEDREAFADVEDVLAAEFADGRVMTGAEALRCELIDQLGYFDDAVQKAEQLGNTTDAMLVEYYTHVGLIDTLLGVKAEKSSSLTRNLLPWRSVNVDVGKLYYLAPETLAW